MSAWRMMIFLGVVSLVWGGGHAYLGWRLIGASQSLSARWAGLAWAALAVMAALGFGVAMVDRLWSKPPGYALLQWAGYWAMGLFATLLLIVVARDLLWAALHGGDLLLRKLAGGGGLGLLPLGALRQRVFDVSGAVALTLAVGGSLVGLWTAARGPRSVEVEVPVQGLHADLEGLRIAQITDLHVTHMIERSYVQRTVDAVAAAKPDLIAVTGDLSDGHLAELRPHLQPLTTLRAPLGVFFVTGNHEYYWQPAEWLAEIQRLGMRVLNNEHVVLRRGAGEIVLAGVPDPAARQRHNVAGPDAAVAFSGAPTGALRVLLAHQPRSALASLPVGFDLAITGHTHGGQFLPFRWIVGAVEPLLDGLQRAGSAWIYVGRGAGFWGPPNRVGVPAEVVLLRLVSA